MYACPQKFVCNLADFMHNIDMHYVRMFFTACTFTVCTFFYLSIASKVALVMLFVTVFGIPCALALHIAKKRKNIKHKKGRYVIPKGILSVK